MRRGRDKRLHTVLLTVTAAGLFGLAVSLHNPSTYGVASDGNPDSATWVPERHVRDMRSLEVQQRFQQAVVMLHARQYDYAIAALHRVLELSPAMPEAHANMGFAMFGKGEHKVAADFFGSAIEINPGQANAYYGLALALDAMCDAKGAIGAMRTFVHLAGHGDAYVRKARSALWEWESQQSGAIAECDGLKRAAANLEDG